MCIVSCNVFILIYYIVNRLYKYYMTVPGIFTSLTNKITTLKYKTKLEKKNN